MSDNLARSESAVRRRLKKKRRLNAGGDAKAGGGRAQAEESTHDEDDSQHSPIVDTHEVTEPEEQDVEMTVADNDKAARLKARKAARKKRKAQAAAATTTSEEGEQDQGESVAVQEEGVSLIVYQEEVKKRKRAEDEKEELRRTLAKSEEEKETLRAAVKREKDARAQAEKALTTVEKEFDQRAEEVMKEALGHSRELKEALDKETAKRVELEAKLKAAEQAKQHAISNVESAKFTESVTPTTSIAALPSTPTRQAAPAPTNFAPGSPVDKHAYGLFLKQQMAEREARLRLQKEAERSGGHEYFPFGKPGGGAPLNPGTPGRR